MDVGQHGQVDIGFLSGGVNQEVLEKSVDLLVGLADCHEQGCNVDDLGVVGAIRLLFQDVFNGLLVNVTLINT